MQMALDILPTILADLKSAHPMMSMPPVIDPRTPNKNFSRSLMDSWPEDLRKDFELFEGLLQDHLVGGFQAIGQMGRYVLDSPGKYMRPLITLIVWRLLESSFEPRLSGGKHKERTEKNSHLILAVVIEYLHTASLLHDDVTDHSTLRRHRKTINALFGDKPGVILGDFFLGRAFNVLATIANGDLIKVFAKGTQKLAEGQMMETLYQNHLANYSLKHYLNMIGKKTGALFQTASESSALAFFLYNKTHSAYKTFLKDFSLYGLYLGKAFQLRDDLLDYGPPLEDRSIRENKSTTPLQENLVGGVENTEHNNAHTWGKTIGKDFQEKKLTYPMLWTYQNSSPNQRQHLESLWQHSSRLECFSDLREILIQAGAFQATQNLAQAYGMKALYHLRKTYNLNLKAFLELPCPAFSRKAEILTEEKSSSYQELLEKFAILSYTRGYS
jgi:octaprenyl-diphosphate synthase